jgi:TPR repeat protein
VEAIIWYRKAAEATYSSGSELHTGIWSAEKLAAIFSEDTGALRNDAEAAKWYLRAAEWGSIKSQRHLGYYYKSADWFRRAAAQGDAASQLELGRMFVSGVGVIQDYTQAYLWLNLAAGGDHMWDDSGDFAALGGEAEAAKLRDTVARVMTADRIAEAQALARRWTLAHEEPLPWTFKLDGPCLAGTAR